MGTRRRLVTKRPGDNVSRLRRALDVGKGHVAVFADNPYDALAFVEAFLAHAARYNVAHVSALRPQAADNVIAQLAPVGTTVVVVDDAEGATAAQLEKLRDACERSVDATERLRLVFVGAAGLERALAKPGARALASRVGARLRVDPIAATGQMFVPEPQESRRWAFVASAMSAAAAIACLAYANLPATRPATRLAVQVAEQAVVLRDRAVDAIARRVIDPYWAPRASSVSTQAPPSLVVTSPEPAPTPTRAIPVRGNTAPRQAIEPAAPPRSPKGTSEVAPPSGAIINPTPGAIGTLSAGDAVASANNPRY
jgi:hypothetical protein